MKTKHIVLVGAALLVAWYIFKSPPETEEINTQKNSEETTELQMNDANEAKNTEEPIVEVVQEEDAETTDFNLSGESLGNGSVKFSWNLPEDVKTDTEKGFVIVRSESENPENNGLNYWIRQSALDRETTWVNIPAGTYHFRICALQNEQCAVYSNNIELEVKTLKH